MIHNQSEYDFAKQWLDKFRSALQQDTNAPNIDPKIAEALTAAIRSQLEDLEKEIADYEKWRSLTDTLYQ